ncbi:Uncharacterized protein BM_BM7517 [Brugia malayi]|uniref:Bm7517 n=1 Tax=Brugia malayi TaxID=6279 RepID=A0A0H5S4L1_BRUMA|nr:Uncharacterized protein BM_BM7517 [Brugia malayi]CRZ23137.1 Bm7517 [Brugia malayi]VIO90536.1 Uncharacterized protein BM_BM7517 [Brugia malayi]
MDEEELLLETPSTFDVSNLSELDESAILGDDDIQEEGSIKDEIVEHHEETEELDYDEDLEAEKAPRLSKFTSERTIMQKRSLLNEASSKRDEQNRSAPTNSASVSKSVKPISLEDNLSRSSQVHSVKNTTGTTRAPKVFINPHHRGVLRPQGSTPHSLPLPWEAAVRVPSVPGLRHPVALPLPNSVTMLPQVSHSVPFPIVPSSSTDFSRPPPQIMPLPNYSTPPPSVYPSQFMAESLGLIPSVGQWDQMVEGFLRRTTAHSRSRFSRSPRSSSSSRSRSHSYSSHSSSSTVSSRSSSRSPYRRVHSRSRRSSSRRPFNHRSRNEVIRRRSRDRLKKSGDGHRESVYHYDRTRNRANDVAKQEKTMECAKAIGLDSEYLTKLEEQKKMREVILRKKEERRIQTVQRLGGPISASDQKSMRQLNRTSNFGERRLEHNRRMDEEHSSRRKFDSRMRKTSGIRNGRKEPVSGTSSDVSREAVNVNRLEASVCAEKGVATNSSVIQKMEPAVVGNDPNMEQTAARVTAVTSVRRAKRENEQNPERTRKKKAYLAVVISSLNQAPINVDRIRIIAETIGPTKKVWRSSENTVSLIFEEHESAKKFMFHYHNRVIHGVQLAVTLQKLFANLTELP